MKWKNRAKKSGKKRKAVESRNERNEKGDSDVHKKNSENGRWDPRETVKVVSTEVS